MRLLLTALLFTSISPCVFGQQAKLTPGQEKLQALKGLIGTWHGTDDSGNPSTASYEWINNKSYIQHVSGDFRQVIGWDLKRKRIVGWGFGTHGGQGEVLWTEESEGEWIANSEWLDRWGKSVQTSAKLTLNGETLRVESRYGDNSPQVKTLRRLQTDTEEYQANTQRWEELFNRHAAAQLADEYAENCDVMNTGTQVEHLMNRAEVLAAYSKYFESEPNVRIALTDVAYRRLGDSMLVETGVFIHSQLANGAADLRGMYSTLYQKQDGRWQIVHERTWWPPATEMSPEEQKALESNELGTYLIGNWTATGTVDGEQVSAAMTVQPTAGGSSLFFTWTASLGGTQEHGSCLSGVEPSTGDVLEIAFTNNGRTKWINRYPKPLGNQTQGTTTGTHTSYIDGEEVVEDVTVTRTSRDRFEYKLSSDGETRLAWVFERSP